MGPVENSRMVRDHGGGSIGSLLECFAKDYGRSQNSARVGSVISVTSIKFFTVL